MLAFGGLHEDGEIGEGGHRASGQAIGVVAKDGLAIGLRQQRRRRGVRHHESHRIEPFHDGAQLQLGERGRAGAGIGSFDRVALASLAAGTLSAAALEGGAVATPSSAGEVTSTQATFSRPKPRRSADAATASRAWADSGPELTHISDAFGHARTCSGNRASTASAVA